MGIELSGQHGKLFLLRHGQTEWNAARRYAGHTDVPLLPEAKQQLAAAKQALQQLAFGEIYSSDLQRVRQTVQIVLPELYSQVKYDARLRELHFGIWEGKTYEELKHDAAYRRWLHDPETGHVPEGERFSELRQRIRSFLQQYCPELCTAEPLPHNVLIVAHGGSIRMLLTELCSDYSFWQAELPCGSVTVFDNVHQTTAKYV